MDMFFLQERVFNGMMFFRTDRRLLPVTPKLYVEHNLSFYALIPEPIFLHRTPEP